MPRFKSQHKSRMSELLMNSIEEVSVVDVYDLASEIGKEFEKMIEKNGADSVASIIPKVINALELLEGLASRNENENSLVQELNDRISQLEAEKTEKAEYRKRFDKELESIEEQWRGESRELLQLINRLQEENRRLLKEQKQSDQTSNKNQSSTNSYSSNQNSDSVLNSPTSDGQIISKLKTQINMQRDELKNKERDIHEKGSDIDLLNQQIERLKNAGRETRRRQKLTQSQIRTLCEERADFLAQLQDQHREILILRKRLGIAEKENEDLIKCPDDDDPHRPRFTTDELKEVLAERNELKSRINDLEEELMACKPIPEIERDSTPIDEDPPVQGPLPYEPDDAPWKKNSESGIRKFFRKLFSESDSDSSSFPRRSLSTLSKMALSAGPHSDIPI